MKIAEMKNCIEKMREIYKFDDVKTEIDIGSVKSMNDGYVSVYTEDENGTSIKLIRRIDELVERK